jgi:hypothetical protein
VGDGNVGGGVDEGGAVGEQSELAATLCLGGGGSACLSRVSRARAVEKQAGTRRTVHRRHGRLSHARRRTSSLRGAAVPATPSTAPRRAPTVPAKGPPPRTTLPPPPLAHGRLRWVGPGQGSGGAMRGRGGGGVGARTRGARSGARTRGGRTLSCGRLHSFLKE